MEIRNQMNLSQGAEELLTTLKWLGFKLGIVSGGFDIFADLLKDKFNLDFAFANRLEIKNGTLTGKFKGNIVDAAQKARLVNQVACDESIPRDQVVVIGDGANDSLMLTQAGLGIAYNEKIHWIRLPTWFCPMRVSTMSFIFWVSRKKTSRRQCPARRCTNTLCHKKTRPDFFICACFFSNNGSRQLNHIQGIKLIIAMFVFDDKVFVFIDRGHCYSFRLKSLRIFSTRRRLAPRSEYPTREADLT
jgi:hypothetical protein